MIDPREQSLGSGLSGKKKEKTSKNPFPIQIRKYHSIEVQKGTSIELLLL